jgi:hypothetical protein
VAALYTREISTLLCQDQAAFYTFVPLREGHPTMIVSDLQHFDKNAIEATFCPLR